VEQKLQEVIFPELSKGDPKWDLPHTKSVVHYVKDILNNVDDTEIDNDVLITAAYAHDWGYTQFYKQGESLTQPEYSEAKKYHMEIGADKIKELLKDDGFSAFNSEQKARIVHLVRVHDKLDSLKDLDEVILMEADTLGGLDTDFVTPSFTKEENERYMNNVKSKRLSLFRNEYSKEKVKELFEKRLNFYKNQ
jgi:hypothetical protein